MRKCKKCKSEFPAEQFPVAATTPKKIFYRHVCNGCYGKQKSEQRNKIRDWYNSYKKKLKCSRCGFDDYRALQFHHKNPSEKSYTIGTVLSRGKAIETLKKEIEKCEILCANCHSIEHFPET